MTQPFDVDAGPGSLPGLDNTGPDAPLLPPRPPPVQPVPPGQPAGGGWLERQKARGAELAGATTAEDDESAAIAAEEAETEWLRQQHGGVETALSQAARGALDAILSPGALAGAYYETLGTATNAKILKDFGRDLGRASSGKSAAEALGAVFGGRSAMAKDAAALVGIGEGATEQERSGALDAASRERRALEEQEKARPLLTTLSRIAGASAASIGVGAAASAHSGAAATIAALGAEGAGTGAQAAYEQAAPLRDVLASAAIGGIIGAGVGAAGEGVQRAIKKAPDLAKVFGDKVQDFADQRAWKAVVDRDPQAMKDWMRWSPERRARVVDRIRESGVLGQGDDAMLAVLNKNADEASEMLGQVAKELDDRGIKPSVGDLRAELQKQTSELRASGSGTMAKLADTIEDEVAPFMQKLAVQQTDEAGNVIGTVFRDPTFTELRTMKQALGVAKKKHMRAQSLQADELRDLYGNFARKLDDAADRAGPELGQAWRSSNERATDFITLGDALENQIARKLKNRFISPSDYGTGIAAGLATTIVTGNPFGALAGIGTALVHKVAREGGSAIASKLANRFARISSRVSRAAAGGPEAQEVLELMKRARMLVDETVERAGVNPTVRQAAEETTRAVAAKEIQKRAGDFNPAEWHARPVTPLQKLVYRSQILDTASDDLARAAKEVEALHPAIPEQLDIRRIEKLTKDAQGPEALASLQARVRELAESAPPTATGDAGGVLLRKLGLELDRAGIAEAMANAHQAAGLLQNASKNAADEVSQNFAERASLALREVLGGEHFGAAGREYRALSASPSELLKELGSAEKVREALRSASHHGGLTKALRDAHGQIGAAHDAAFKLAGAARPAELGKALTNAERLFHAAETATTIDGKAFHKMFEVAGHVGVHEGIPHGEAPPMTVAEAVEPGLEKVATAIRHEVSAKAGKVTKDTYTPPYLRAGTAAGAAASWPALLDEKRDVYDRRLKQLEAIATRTDIPRNYQGALAGDVDGKLAKLLQDMPKPTPSLKGKAFESMSEGDLNKANAMWEATTQPLSLFDDLSSGTLDYEKVSYTWVQYPGLQQACQAGVMDVLISDLSEDERSGVPDSMLTQLDYAFGFKGTLQDTVEHGFSTRMSAMYVPPPQPGAPKGMLESPAADKTFTQRIASG